LNHIYAKYISIWNCLHCITNHLYIRKTMFVYPLLSFF
jgi:hypothetical protein